MLTRFLGGTVACLGAAGMLSAQQPYTQSPTQAQGMPPAAYTPGYPQVYSQPVAGSSRQPVFSRLFRSSSPGNLPVRALPVSYNARADTPKPAAAAPAPSTNPNPGPAGKASQTPNLQTPHSQILTQGGCPTTCPTYTECSDPCAACCTPCGPPGRNWIDAGWIFWTTSGQRVPPLVTTAPAGTPRATAGALGQPTTSVLYPTSNPNSAFRSGFYLNAGHWFDQCQTRGIEGNFFFLGDSISQYSAGSPGDAIITRPFFNTQRNAPDTELVSFPGVLQGGVDVRSKNQVIGGGPNFIRNLCCGPCGRFDLLLGYSYLNVRDDITIRETLTSLPGQTNVAPGTRFQIEDRFRTNNNFHGFNIGFAGERRWSHWYLGYRAGVALGVNYQTIDISGNTTIISPDGTRQNFAGGLLTQPSNIGRYTRDEFAVMPWVGVKLGCQLTERMRVYVGYDFFALTNVARAGDQIDLRVNSTQIPPRANGVQGQAFPQFTPRDSTFVGQGIRIGAEFRF